MNNEIKELLTEIQDWMLDNDYECGEVGSDIYQRITGILAENENEDDNPIKSVVVNINGKLFTLPNPTVTYETIIKLIAPHTNTLLTMTYFRGKDDTHGSLVPGGKSMLADNGTIFNAYFTGNA